MTKEERELAIDIFEDNFTVIDTHGHYTDEEENLAIEMAIEALKEEPRRGHWVDKKCSICGCKSMLGMCIENYCANCGAKMK